MKIKLQITLLMLFLLLGLSHSARALNKMEFIRENEYGKLGQAVDSQKFGKTMLELNGYLQFPVKIIPDPEARQAWPLRSPYTNTACAAYEAESRQSTGNTVEIVDYQTASARIWAEAGKDIFELPDTPFLHLKDSYGDLDGKSYQLTPIETRAGDIVKREWCLEPDKTYTLAILDFGGPLLPGPDGQVEYFSAFHFYFTDPLPENQLTRIEKESCPSYFIFDATTGECTIPHRTTPSLPVQPLGRIWILIRVALGLAIVGLISLVIWYFRRRYRK